MVDQLSAFASEITRITFEVGTQGTLGGQARVEVLQGTWAHVTQHVNVRESPFHAPSPTDRLQKMASNITDQVRSISQVAKAVTLGDLDVLVEVDAQGELLDLKTTVNCMVGQLSAVAREVTRVSLVVGTEGFLGEQVVVPGVRGIWRVRL